MAASHSWDCRQKGQKKERSDLYVDRRAGLNIDYLGAAPFKEHGLGIVELAIENPDLMVLVSSYTEAVPSIQRISARSLSSYVRTIQEHLIAAHALGNYCSCGIASGCSNRLVCG